ncbi:hypothetical protein HDV01_002617 [Terramyces sp. JEL0728]|nr:hypothetical protein HDV01_002617 [Terramyces sp. JEL0728]
MPPFRTFLGARVWPGNFLKLYFPFIISGSTIYFLVASTHTQLMDAPDDKWVGICDNVRESSAQTAMKQEAEKYLREHKKH